MARDIHLTDHERRLFLAHLGFDADGYTIWLDKMSGDSSKEPLFMMGVDSGKHWSANARRVLMTMALGHQLGDRRVKTICDRDTCMDFAHLYVARHGEMEAFHFPANTAPGDQADDILIGTPEPYRHTVTPVTWRVQDVTPHWQETFAYDAWIVTLPSYEATSKVVSNMVIDLRAFIDRIGGGDDESSVGIINREILMVCHQVAVTAIAMNNDLWRVDDERAKARDESHPS